MTDNLLSRFTDFWENNFGSAELPLAYYYTEEAGQIPLVPRPDVPHRCIFTQLDDVRKGGGLCFSQESFACNGVPPSFGLTQVRGRTFPEFLSCGIAGKFEGKRYKRSPELVRQWLEHVPPYTAPGSFIVFKRWDALVPGETPEVVIFFAPPDIISALHALANFDTADADGVTVPWGSGCAAIAEYPYLEKSRENPRGVIGMFDISARPHVESNTLTFAVPLRKLATMVENAGESFLTTRAWQRVRERI